MKPHYTNTGNPVDFPKVEKHMIPVQEATMRQALEALEAAANFFANIDLHESFNPPTANFGSQVEELLIAAEPALRAALAEPVQEPVAWLYEAGTDRTLHWYKPPLHGTPLYTAPPQRKPLTDDEVIAAIKNISFNEMTAFNIARAIERAHGIGDKQ